MWRTTPTGTLKATRNTPQEMMKSIACIGAGNNASGSVQSTSLGRAPRMGVGKGLAGVAMAQMATHHRGRMLRAFIQGRQRCRASALLKSHVSYKVLLLTED